MIYLRKQALVSLGFHNIYTDAKWKALFRSSTQREDRQYDNIGF